MAQVFKIKNSQVEGKIPDPENLAVAELAVNLKDKKLFTKNADNDVIELTSSGGGGGGGNSPIKPPAVLTPHNGDGNNGSADYDVTALSSKVLDTEINESGSAVSLTLDSLSDIQDKVTEGSCISLTDGSTAADGSYVEINYSRILNPITAVEDSGDNKKLTFTGTAADDNKDLKLITPGTSIAGPRIPEGRETDPAFGTSASSAQWMTIAGGNGRWVFSTIETVLWGDDTDPHWYRGKQCYLWENGKRKSLKLGFEKIFFGRTAAGEPRFLAVEYSIPANNIYCSKDGENWEYVYTAQFFEDISSTSNRIDDIVYDPAGRWYAVNEVNNSKPKPIYFSDDGFTWQFVEPYYMNHKFYAAWNGVFYMYIYNNKSIISTVDFQTYKQVPSLTSNYNANGIYAGRDANGKDVIVFATTTLYILYHEIDTLYEDDESLWKRIALDANKNAQAMIFNSENNYWAVLTNVGVQTGTLVPDDEWAPVEGSFMQPYKNRDVVSLPFCFANGKFAFGGNTYIKTAEQKGGIALYDGTISTPQWDPSVSTDAYCPSPEYVVSVDLATNSLVATQNNDDFWQVGDVIDAGARFYYSSQVAVDNDNDKLTAANFPRFNYIKTYWPDSDNRLGTDIYIALYTGVKSLLKLGRVSLLSTPFSAEPADVLSKIVWEIDGTEVDAGTVNPYTPDPLMPGLHTVRVKHVGVTSGDSAWSSPVQFVTGSSVENETTPPKPEPFSTNSATVEGITREILERVTALVDNSDVSTTDLLDENEET